MARLNKFASVNFNDSYGKPDRGGSANSGNNGAPSAPGKPRISSSAGGGMLVLSRPGRTQAPSPPPKPGQARLGIPSPVNLPSMKRQISDGPASPPNAGWSRAESPPAPHLPAHDPKPASARSLDTPQDGLKAMASGSSGAYAPPAMRMAMESASASATRLRPPPQLEAASPIIRGEEFPTLQAAVARPPTPPQHPRQKDVQQRQRDRHQEAKEQQLKLQLLSHQVQGHKQGQPDVSQAQSQSQALSLRPLGRPESVYQKGTMSCLGPSSPPTQDRSAYPDESLLSSPSTGNSSRNNNNISKSSDMLPASDHMSSDGNFCKVSDARESRHNLRPQYRVHSNTRQSSSIIEAQQPGLQVKMTDSSRLSSFNQDFVPWSRRLEPSNYPGGSWTSSVDDKVASVSESGPLIKDRYLSKDFFFRQDGDSVTSIIRGPHTDRGGSVSDPISSGSLPGQVLDPIPEKEGLHSRASFVGKLHNRDMIDNKSAWAETEYCIRDSGGTHDVDVRDSRQNLFLDGGAIYNRDFKEASGRDSQNVYARAVAEEGSPNSALIAHLGYDYAHTITGDSSQRSHGRDIDSCYRKRAANTTGILATHNPSPVYDTQHRKQYGFKGTGDEVFTEEVCASSGPKVHTSPCMDETSLYTSNSQALVSSRARSPVLRNISHDLVKEVRKIHPEGLEKLALEGRQVTNEDRMMNAKEGCSESYGLDARMQRPIANWDSTTTQGYGMRSSQSNNNKHDDERCSREDANKQFALEDERRREAAKLKLMELEARIARKVADARKEDIDVKFRQSTVGSFSQQQQKVEPSRMSSDDDSDAMVARQPGHSDLKWGAPNSGSKLEHPHPLPVSSVFLGTFKNSSKGATPYQEPDSCYDGEFNQDQKTLQPRSRSPWRKEVGSGPTSKLFSSPYIEGGGFRRISDGGTYKLF